MFTTEDRYWLNVYSELSTEKCEVIDRVAAFAMTAFRDAGFRAAGDDVAEALVAAATRYFCQSGNER